MMIVRPRQYEYEIGAIMRSRDAAEGSKRTRVPVNSPATEAASRTGARDWLNLPVRVDAPIGVEKPIPEIVDYRKVATGIPVVEKMELFFRLNQAHRPSHDPATW